MIRSLAADGQQVRVIGDCALIVATVATTAAETGAFREKGHEAHGVARDIGAVKRGYMIEQRRLAMKRFRHFIFRVTTQDYVLHPIHRNRGGSANPKMRNRRIRSGMLRGVQRAKYLLLQIGLRHKCQGIGGEVPFSGRLRSKRCQRHKNGGEKKTSS